MSADEDALKLVDDFEKDGSAAGVWRAIRKDEVVAGLRERIKNKDGLNQHNMGLCGPAALVHIELQDDPASFVNLATGLYKSGQASWRGAVVKPNAELLANPPPDGQVLNGTAQVFNRADWIVMASIRNTANPADHFNRSSSSTGTFMHELEAFIRQVGYTSVEADYIENSGSVGESNARKATLLLGRGYRVMLTIDSVMLDTATQTNWGQDGWRNLWGLASKANHIVQLVDGIEFLRMWIYPDSCPVESDSPDATAVVSFEVYTWAQGHRKVPQNPDIPLKVKDFLWNYYGYLAFKN
jgi:hypothetical protein